jgi:hypothetical protein
MQHFVLLKLLHRLCHDDECTVAGLELHFFIRLVARCDWLSVNIRCPSAAHVPTGDGNAMFMSTFQTLRTYFQFSIDNHYVALYFYVATCFKVVARLYLVV